MKSFKTYKSRSPVSSLRHRNFNSKSGAWEKGRKLFIPVCVLMLMLFSSILSAHPFIPGDISTTDVFSVYLQLGFTHILPMGLDHILFILGLYFLSNNLKTVLIQATAFTVAHSITLGLAMFKVVSAPSSIVEPIIALSIVFIAVENIVTKKLHSWRIVIVFLFGLIHGLGFASVLLDLGLPDSQFITALVAFNVGVELGQITIILSAFLIVGKWFGKKEWYRGRVVIPVSICIACIAAYWTVERIIG
ncbi:hypothetical protein BH10BAC5_BH10BAC5_14740 [soil metagenome]